LGQRIVGNEAQTDVAHYEEKQPFTDKEVNLILKKLRSWAAAQPGTPQMQRRSACC